ncbi:MAG TPA: hypothetical protein VF823_04800 [Anaerolineales bacterium]
MEDNEIKPLNWAPAPGVGYTVTRRPDGGMHYVFTNLSHATLAHWRSFALDHLLDSDRLTRNLYDLRLVKQLPAEAVTYAVEVNNDPAARNIRVAVLVADEAVRRTVREVADLTAPGGVELAIFTDLDEAEAWLDRPLTLLT